MRFRTLTIGAAAVCFYIPGCRASDAPQLEETKQAASAPVTTQLSLDAVLSWRAKYGDLVGKPLEAAVERFGPGKRSPTEEITFEPNSEHEGRRVVVLTRSEGKTATITVVKVFARPDENLDPVDVLKKANLFTFGTGTYRDLLENYWTAKTLDSRNAFQFDVSEKGVSFRAVSFGNPLP